MTAVYYNEIDPYAAQWLRNLMAGGLIPHGDVDERSIEDVKPDELRGYQQCHFFAGIGGWPHALALAGWPSDRPVWTGSCPCQPFSSAGKGAGFADERHLWPAWFHLIAQCHPPVVFGEQVAGKAVGPWVDLVQADLEALDYAFGCVPFPAAGVGAPHIRDRTYWVADANGMRSRRNAGAVRRTQAQGDREGFEDGRQLDRSRASGATRRLADLHDDGREPRGEGRAPVGHRPTSEPNRGAVGLADASDIRFDGRWSGEAGDGRDAARFESERFCDAGGSAGPVNGHWRDADWLYCRDGKWRPVEPGTFPLAHGIPGRVGRLRAYGNAIVPQQAAQFIAAFLDHEQENRT